MQDRKFLQMTANLDLREDPQIGRHKLTIRKVLTYKVLLMGLSSEQIGC